MLINILPDMVARSSGQPDYLGTRNVNVCANQTKGSPISPSASARGGRASSGAEITPWFVAREGRRVHGLCLVRPSLRGANGSRECAPDDRLRDETIQSCAMTLDCFASLAMTVSGSFERALDSQISDQPVGQITAQPESCIRLAPLRPIVPAPAWADASAGVMC
jgi:hypothetical protein